MDTQKNFFILFGEWLQARQARRQATAHDRPSRRSAGWLPSRGNVIFTLAMIALLAIAQSAGALPLGRPLEPALSAAKGSAHTTASTSTIAYQGRLANANDQPLTGNYGMEFRLYDVSSGGTPLWSETWTGSNSVSVSDGLFNIMLGSLNPIPQSVITGHSSLWLGITVGSDTEMVPRVQLGSVPFAVQALTVPDGSVTTAKIADGAVTTAKLADGAVTSTQLADAISVSKLRAGNDTSEVWVGGDPNGQLEIRSIVGGTPYIDLSNDSTTDYDVRMRLIGDDQLIVEGTENGYVQIFGSLIATGAKSAVVQAGDHGQRKLYAIEAPDVRFSDEGLAHMRGGLARVELDPIFLETIEGNYLIHITPYGDASLYVAEVGREYFVVRARAGDPDVAFAWRLSATRKGYAGVRLEETK
jgi:hypothetical protein